MILMILNIRFDSDLPAALNGPHKGKVVPAKRAETRDVMRYLLNLKECESKYFRAIGS